MRRTGESVRTVWHDESHCLTIHRRGLLKTRRGSCPDSVMRVAVWLYTEMKGQGRKRKECLNSASLHFQNCLLLCVWLCNHLVKFIQNQWTTGQHFTPTLHWGKMHFDYSCNLANRNATDSPNHGKHWALRPQKPLRLIRDREVGGWEHLLATLSPLEWLH